MCDQQSLRPACAYAQSDQSLCLSLEYSMIVKLLTERHLEFLSLKGGCRGSSESTLVKMSNCWKSHALAQLSNWFSVHKSIFCVCEQRSLRRISSCSSGPYVVAYAIRPETSQAMQCLCLVYASSEGSGEYVA